MIKVPKPDRGVQNILMTNYSLVFLEILNNFCHNPGEYRKIQHSREVVKDQVLGDNNYWFHIQKSIDGSQVLHNKKLPVLAFKICLARAMEEYQRIKYAARKNGLNPKDIYRDYKFECCRYMRQKAEDMEKMYKTDPLFKRKTGIFNKLNFRPPRALEILNYQTKSMDKERKLHEEKMNDQEELKKMREKLQKENKLKILVGNKENYLDDYKQLDLVKIYDGYLCSTYYLREKEEKILKVPGHLKVKDVITKENGIFISNNNKNSIKNYKNKPNKHSKSHFDFSKSKKRKSSENKSSFLVTDFPLLTTKNNNQINNTDHSSLGTNELNKLMNESPGKSSRLVINKTTLKNSGTKKNIKFCTNKIISPEIKNAAAQSLFILPSSLGFNFKPLKKIKEKDYMSKTDFYYSYK